MKTAVLNANDDVSSVEDIETWRGARPQTTTDSGMR